MRGLAAVLVSLALATSALGCSSGDDSGQAVGGSGGSSGSAHAGSSGSSGAAHAGSSGSAAAGAEPVGDAGSAGTDTGGAAGVGGQEQAGSPGTAGSSGSAGSAGSSGTGGTGGTGGTAGAGTAGSGGTAGAAQGGSGGAEVVTVPSDPTTLVLQVVDATTVNLSWTDVASNETGYNVYWSTTADKPAQPNTQLAANTVTYSATALTTGQAYHFWVEAYNSAGASQALTGSATPAPVPAAPTALVATGAATQLTLTWTNNASADTGYRIFYATTNTQPPTAQYEIAADSTTYTFAAGVLTPYTPYYFWVSAFNATGNSAAATTTGTVGTAPSAPTGVTVDVASNLYSIDVKWTDSSTNSNGFNVYWSTDDTQPATPNTTVGAGVTEYKLKTIFGNQTYRFWIEATNAIGKSAAAMATAPAATADLTWNELWLDDGNNIHLALKDNLGGLTGGDAGTALYAYHSASPTAMGSATSIAPYVIWNVGANNINTAAIHYFWTEARTSSGSLFSLRTMSPAGAVTGLLSSPSTFTENLTWAATDGAAAYQTFWGTAAFGAAFLAGDSQLTASTVTGLNPAVQYSFWVRALAPAIHNGGGQYGFPGPETLVQDTIPGTSIGANLALGKTAVASSGGSPGNVADGNIGTRWQAGSEAAGQWIYVDLGSSVAVSHVKFVWEAAYATAFVVEVCAASCATQGADVNMWSWQTAYTGSRTLSGPFPYFELLALTTPTVGQFVRMRTTATVTYGASLWELEAYAAP